MSPQADFIVSNGTGAAVRSDLNVQFAAIVSNNSGATEPATMYAYQWWADTTAGLLKLRNSANSAWITMRQLDGEFSTVPVENGSAAAPSIYFKDSGTDSGFFSPGTDAVAISTAGTNRLHITSGGLVGIGSSAPGHELVVRGAEPYLEIRDNRNKTWSGEEVYSGILFGTDDNTFPNDPQAFIKAVHTRAGTGHTSADAGLTFGTSESTVLPAIERVRITYDGKVGIGNTGPDAKLHITGGASFTGGEANLAVTSSTTASVPATISSLNSDATLQIFAGGLGSGGSRGGQIDLKGGAAATDAGAILFRTGTGTGGTSQTEKARLDASASGRLLVGTSSTSSSLPRLIVSGGADGGTTPAILVANTGATPTDGTALGVYDFSAANHSAAARIIARRDGGTWTAGSSQPTRLEFSTTADGASSPTERMRINRNGIVYIYTAYTYNAVGSTRDVYVESGGSIGYVSSVREHKTNIKNIENIDWIYDLNPVEFNRRKRDEQLNYLDESYPEKEYGLIADEVEVVQPEMCFYDKLEDGSQKLAGVHYRQLIAPLLKAVQDLKAENESLKARVSALEAS
jgi:hypothetical protein